MKFSHRMAGALAALAAASAFGAAPTTAVAGAAAPPELLLAGGALNICSALSPRHCVDGTRFPTGRGESRYRLDAAGIAAATDPRLWVGAEEGRGDALAALLQAVQRRFGSGALDGRAMRAAMEAACRRGAAAIACLPSPLWSRLDEHERSAVLAALELPQVDTDGKRMMEQVSLAQGRDPAGAQILRAFVAAAALRGQERPTVAVVTASGFDSMDAVDYYLGVLRQAGAAPRWWPIDAAAAAVVFGHGDCSRLDAERIARLGVPGRARVYPDHATTQEAWCRSPQAGKFPDDLAGVFFAGGDQWRLRRALVDEREQPNAWLRGLREAFDAGRIVVGGTSAGSAVQSAAAMIGNGTSAHALEHGTRASAPPDPGCGRSGRCVGGLDEDAVTWWPAGGIGLAAPFVVDTHFSERSREWRLLALLADSGQRFGLGVDETSALRLRRQADGSLRIDALGAHGGWLFALQSMRCGDVSGQAHYLAPGVEAHWRDGAFDLPPAVTSPPSAAPARVLPLAEGLRAGALRSALQALVPLDAPALRFEDPRAVLQLSRGAQTVAFAGRRELRSVLAAQFSLQWRAPDCAAP